MKFLVDENLPPRLAAWLNARGHDAMHVRELGLKGAADGDILVAAAKAERVIVTRDRDFDVAVGTSVLRICVGNAPTLALLTWLETRIEDALTRLGAGERLVLIED